MKSLAIALMTLLSFITGCASKQLSRTQDVSTAASEGTIHKFHCASDHSGSEFAARLPKISVELIYNLDNPTPRSITVTNVSGDNPTIVLFEENITRGPLPSRVNFYGKKFLLTTPSEPTKENPITLNLNVSSPGVTYALLCTFE